MSDYVTSNNGPYTSTWEESTWDFTIADSVTEPGVGSAQQVLSLNPLDFVRHLSTVNIVCNGEVRQCNRSAPTVRRKQSGRS